MNINSERLWNRIHKLSEIGKDENGGVTRLSFTETERKAKDLVVTFMKDAGLAVREDEIGNLIGRKEGAIFNSQVVMTGSHIDSVISGGNFDGPAGVLSAIEALQTMNEKGIVTESPLEVIVFTDEEGARFSTGMLGSLSAAGKLSKEELYSAKDKNGVTIAEAMKQAGLDPELAPNAKRNPEEIKAYVELHIEQGKVLENADASVGIVTGIVGVDWYRVTLKGEAGHAGTTPMGLRKDPLAAAARIISYGEEMARNEKSAVVTVGQIEVKPGGINIIPGEVAFSFDIRDINKENMNDIFEKLKAYIETTCEERGIELEIEQLHSLDPSPCSERIMKKMEESFTETEVQSIKLISGAGHDAMVMASITDMGMIFIRSKDGISHNPKEWSDQKDLAMGAEVLFTTLVKLAS
ncbi:Zn-dependent hydrolase [Neobacillus terrae]|uniref:Zn-dependent hydrolase n=1 Tax=Neobacillus terrae TaxID=3034837 RepID=UPI00140D61DE|nr:Zn-dependent hydrolase [Neobacillus terrae]NHM32525.1 Zn-dependent hydrolase [Neobacillus terrae]